MKDAPRKFRGRIQVYTGNGKGKTTAALGLALRAAGWAEAAVLLAAIGGAPDTVVSPVGSTARAQLVCPPGLHFRSSSWARNVAFFLMVLP